jgi:hypothetical protein
VVIMHGHRTGRIVRMTITAALAIALTGCADQGGPSAPVGPATSNQPPPNPDHSAAPSVAGPESASPAASPAAASANPAKVVDGKRYRPTIIPAEFTTQITNAYLPLIPGTAMTYQGAGEKDVFNVTDRTREVMGVTTIVVRDQAYEGSALIEDTEDWFAQDAAGNVWYFGESTAECDGHQVVSRHGSWEAGVDGAQPGIVMLANPEIGAYYRQEYLRGEAEDVARVLRLGATVTHKTTTYPNVVITEDFTKLEPAVVEHKKYAPGVGLVEEQLVKGGSGIVRLIDVDPTAGSGPSTAGALCRG